MARGRGFPRAAKDLGYKDDGLQGQFRLPDGRQCMQFLQIATDGGLLPKVITRDSFELWPAKRREVVIDFPLPGRHKRAAHVRTTSSILTTS